MRRTGHALTSRLDALNAAHVAAVEDLKADAQKRKQVVSERLRELEAESSVLNNLIGVR